MSSEQKMTVVETIYRKYGEVSEVQYEYDENGLGETKHYRINWPRYEHERAIMRSYKPLLSYENFVKVLRTFMMGKFAKDDIWEAFRLLDSDRSGLIDYNKLYDFIRIIVPRVDPYLLVRYIQRSDRDGDFKLNFNEFKIFVEEGFGRDASLGIQ